MADDIQIKSANSSSAHAAPIAGVSKANPTQSNQDGAAVIDLRQMDNKPVVGADAQNAQTTGTQPAAAQTGAQATSQRTTQTGAQATSQGTAQTGAQAAAAKPAKAGAISLDDDTPADYTSPGGQKYSVPAMVKEKFPDLVQLIKETESMNDEEREYWFQILPIMTEEQIKKFRDILVNEKEQLTKLDKEYEQELNKLNEKHMIEWKEFETKEKRKALTQAEQKAKAVEQAEEEDLLKRLSQV